MMSSSILKGLKESFLSILPVIAIVLIMAPFIGFTTYEIILFLASSFVLAIGISLFTHGAKMSMMMIGENIGKKLVNSKKIILIFVLTFLMGIIVTLSEPDLKVLTMQLTTIPSNLIIFTVSIGVGLFLLIATIRTLFGLSLSKTFTLFYFIVFVLVCLSDPANIAISFDAGGVTTGPMSAPFIIALGVGFSARRIDKEAGENSFGLIGLCSIGPIIAVLILGMLFKSSGTYEYVGILQGPLIEVFLKQFFISFKNVITAIVPIFCLYLVFQLITKTFKTSDNIKILIGFLLTILGLSMFLVAVNTGFMHAGYETGKIIGNSAYKYLLIPIGMLMGYFVVNAEPAVKILNLKIEEATKGSISVKLMKRALSIGVSIAIGLAMFRTLFGISILYFIVPVYFVSVVLTFIVPKVFTSVAFDAGGVVAGPLTVAFMLPIAIGAATSLNNDILTAAFGLVALIAMTPPITVQLVGLAYKIKLNKLYKERNIDENIIEYNWEEKK